MSIRLPRLLDAQQQEIARLSPIRLSMDLRLTPLSTAELILPCSSPAISARALIEIYDEHGSAGIFRVSGMEEEPGLRRTVYLEHGLATLTDSIVPAMGMTGSVREVLDTLLDCQNDHRWQSGDIDLPEELTVIFSCGHQNLLTALMELMALLPDSVMLAFDQTNPVWTLHLRALSDTDACEGRLSRNLSGVRITSDCSDVCTRVYPFGAGQGTERISLMPLLGVEHIESDASARWGVVSRTFTANAIFDVPTLEEVARKYLERHSEPTVSVTADAIDLSAATGESADSFRIGRMCRLALPQEDTVLNERVIGIHRPDVYGKPGLITLTLSNRISDASDEIADMLREVTASRILGGRVADATTHNRAEGTSTSRIEHYFRVEDWAAVLSCQVIFDPDDGVRVVDMMVDNNPVPDEAWSDGAFDALPYLRRDSLGMVTTGRHTLAIYPDSGAVNSTVTLKVIEKL